MVVVGPSGASRSFRNNLTNQIQLVFAALNAARKFENVLYALGAFGDVVYKNIVPVKQYAPL